MHMRLLDVVPVLTETFEGRARTLCLLFSSGEKMTCPVKWGAHTASSGPVCQHFGTFLSFVGAMAF